ncbi:hypothetical protein OG559_28500 [Micromonospora sp. NBC_01405]|uniref:hypothetical protein n=1 Tax=Micromonospora sp. NBC_01405 TaxID=2903589 RepID=UPI00324C6DFC
MLYDDQEALDAWVREQTDGVLDRMPVTINPLTTLMLASVLVARIQYTGAPPAKRPLQVRLLLDRPFAFVARHRHSGLALIAGWVAQADASSA